MLEPGYESPDPDDAGPPISWLRVPEGKTAKNRVRMNIRVTGKEPAEWVDRDRLIRGKVTDLVALGAMWSTNLQPGPCSTPRR